VLLHFLLSHGGARNDDWVLVHVGHEHTLAEGRLVVDPRARITVAAGANLEVERAVDPDGQWMEAQEEKERRFEGLEENEK